MNNNSQTITNNNSFSSNIISWILGIIVFAIGILNLIFVHPVPGIIFLFLSLLFISQTNTLIRKNFGFSIPLVVKIILGIIIIWFTLGVSDLGDMLDDLILNKSH
ncbi:MAG: hypothetical protein ACXWCZ_03765 [Flavisolibacter sp.]